MDSGETGFRCLRRRWLALHATVTIATTASILQASPSARLVYLRTPEAASCPDEPVLRKAVVTRFGYDPFFPWAQNMVVVQVTRERNHFSARLQIVDPKGLVRGTRELTSDEDGCSELFDAMALAISIALDEALPSVPTAPVDSRSSPLPSAPAESRSASSKTDVRATPPRTSPDKVVPPATAATGTSAQPTRSAIGAAKSPASTATAYAVGAAIPWAFNLAPSVTPGLLAFVEARLSALAPISLGVEGIAHLSFVSEVEQAGNVQLSLFGATFAPCLRGSALAVCALGEIGVLRAWRADTAPGPPSQETLFAAAGARARIDLPLSEQLFLRLHGDLVINLRRATLEVDLGKTWLAPPVAAMLGVGVGAHFP